MIYTNEFLIEEKYTSHFQQHKKKYTNLRHVKNMVQIHTLFVMIQLFKTDKNSKNIVHFEGETSFYNISN
jgi:hypothetical protein